MKTNHLGTVLSSLALSAAMVNGFDGDERRRAWRYGVSKRNKAEYAGNRKAKNKQARASRKRNRKS